MSIRQQIPFLEALAQLDEQIRVLDEDLKLRRGGIEGLRTEVAGLTTKIADARTSVATMEKTRNELHAEARQMGTQVDKSREKLARSRNERESVAAQREIEELRKLVRDREIEVEKLTSLIDRARASIAQDEARQDELQKDLAGDTQGFSTGLAERENERAELLAKREGATKALPPVLYRRYESIRPRRPRPIASTYDGTCNGCHIAVPPMMFQKMLRQEEFEQCPNCRRILYYVPKPEAGSGSAT